MELRRKTLKHALSAGCALAVLAMATGAAAEQRTFNIASSKATDAIPEFARQAGVQIVAPAERLRGVNTKALEGQYDTRQALAMLIEGTGLKVVSDDGRTIMLAADAPQSGSAAGGGAEVEALIVTAQKREEDIQDVPIAISAFTQEDLTRSQVAGGPDLITQVPNMTFTKTNFSSYSIQLRGIGTQAISATTDPAVAVAFNNTPFIRNRFFEQEFYDLQRVEVLRGPQGTLYGRNATAGVVNIISQKPRFQFEAKASGDVSNFSSSRIEGMVNIPLVEDIAALRVAGAWTKRDGYATNQLTGNPIDGRDLWSTRVSLRVSPNDRIEANLIWEHFQESDDRLRSGKQLCTKDDITEVAGFDVSPIGQNADGSFLYRRLPNVGQGGPMATAQANFSQGCKRGSLYSPEAFQTPLGVMLPYYVPLGSIGLPITREDPYVSSVQSRDLRVIESTVDPTYRAKNDLGELQISVDIGEHLTLASETSYADDFVYSLQDFNRFNTISGAWQQPNQFARPGVLTTGPNGGIFCDPQLGCSDRMIAVDVSTAKATQFSQEFRLSSNFDGAFNYSVGANFLRADSEDKYYVFINSLSLIMAMPNTYGPLSPYVGGITDNRECLFNGYEPGDVNIAHAVNGCGYMDPNPIESVNDQGHNYFLSKNPYKLMSYAVFGEAYYNFTDALKLTAGLRWTVDKKEAPRIPSWLVAIQSYGYPVAEVIEQEWREPTGRLALDWKPDLAFTDETLLYASFAHGYKAGGANPPGYVRVYYADPTVAAANIAASATRPKTFDPEFVDAFELGSKNTVLDGAATLNIAAFYYDYKDYQVSEIVDRSAFNRNFDAKVWGIELESEWRPLENLKLGLKVGYEKTRIGDGEQAIDLMDRTAGDSRWMVVRPFPTYASSCILPTWLHVGNTINDPSNPELILLGGGPGGSATGCEYAYIKGVDPAAAGRSHGREGVINYTAWSTNPDDYAGLVWPGGVVTDRTYPGWDPSTAPNNGEGIMKPLGGNALPNAPEWTATITADYTIPLPNEWLVTLHTDLHWQAESYWRVFQDNDFSTLDEYFTMNLAAIFTNEEQGWNVMAYIKNVTDETAITGAFLNSDDTGLTTNVFLTEPRLYGLRVTKAWTGGSTWGPFGSKGEPSLFVELGGQVQRHDAPYETVRPVMADEFSDAINNFEDAQNRDLDWGDGREIRLTYAPVGRGWRASAGFRTSVSNATDHDRDTELVAGGCAIGQWLCDNNPLFTKYQWKGLDYSDIHVKTNEEHEFIDFAVGRSVGVGLFGEGQSWIEGGLRYAALKSTTHLDMGGIPDWYSPDSEYIAFIQTPHSFDKLEAMLERDFKGFGPEVTWDVHQRLLGNEDVGHLNVDWKVGGGVLFGKQKTTAEGDETVQHYGGNVFAGLTLDGPAEVTAAPDDRSTSVTAPFVDVSLGLSYDVQRFKVSAGYRWERYFDVLDVGYDEHKDADRTIDGPYFKIAVGFGG
ncbi:MAG TPA: TonB-dependent receptor [Caulobacteraceae bacterium]